MKKCALLLVILLLAVVPCAARSDTAADEAAVRAIVDDVWTKIAAKKYDGKELTPDGFWEATSQGGLWQFMDRESQQSLLNDSPNTLKVAASHIQVTFLGSKRDVAYATFYLTGTIRLSDGAIIPDYRTRASWVLEKKGEDWVVSGAHYSPLFGGSGVRFD